MNQLSSFDKALAIAPHHISHGLVLFANHMFICEGHQVEILTRADLREAYDNIESAILSSDIGCELQQEIINGPLKELNFRAFDKLLGIT